MSYVALAKARTRYECVMNALNSIEEEIRTEIAQHRKVLIKPNMVFTENQNCATNVEALRAVIEVIQRYKPEEILVAEGSSLVGTGKESFNGFKYYGYLELKKEYPLLQFYDLNQDLENYDTLKLININREEVETKISKTALEDWYRISLTKPKTHSFAIITLSMKNMMGCIIGYDKRKVHGYVPGETITNLPSEQIRIESYKVIHQNIVRLVKAVPPNLSVIDGFEAMGGDGPVHGKMVSLNIAVASNDYVAADATMSKVVGFDPMNIGYIYYAHKESLGCGDLSKIKLVGPQIEKVKIQLEPHPNNTELMKWKPSEWYP